MRHSILLMPAMFLLLACGNKKYISQIPFKYDYSLELLKKDAQMEETGLKNKTRQMLRLQDFEECVVK